MMLKRKEAVGMGETCVSLIGHNLSDLTILARIDLSKCESLTLHNNLLRNLHGIPALDRITELNLSSNNITDCKLPELSMMPVLTLLDLSANKLQSIQFYPSRLPSLEILSVAYNAVSSIHGLDFSVPNLMRLDLSGNEIYDLQEVLNVLPGFSRLESLSIKGNPVCPNISKVSDIFFSSSSLQLIDGHPCSEWINAESTVAFTPRFDHIRDELMAQLEAQKAAQQQLLQHQQLQAQQYQPVSLFSSPLSKQQHKLTDWAPEPVAALSTSDVTTAAENNLKKYLILNRYLRLGFEAEFQSMNIFFQGWKATINQNKTEAKIAAMANELASVRARHSDELKALQTKLEAAEKEKIESNDALSKAEVVVADLKQQIVRVSTEREAAVSEVTSKLNEQWSAVEQSLQTEKAVLTTENTHLREEVERCGASVESIEAMTSIMKEQLRLHQANEQHLEQLHSATQSEVVALREALKASEVKLSALQSDHSVVQQVLSLQRESNLTLQESLTASEVCREAVKIEFQTFKAQSTAQQQLICYETAKREDEALIHQLKIDKAYLTETIGKLETRLLKMHTAMEQLKLQHAEALAQQVDLVEKHQREERKCLDLLNDCRKLQEVAEVYKQEAHKATKYKKQLTSTKEQLDETTERLKKAEAVGNEWRDKSVSANVVVDQLKDTLRDLQHTVKDLQSDNDRLINTNKSGVSAQEDLQTRLTVKEKIVEDKMHLVEELKKKLTQASADLVTLRNSCVELETRLLAAAEELEARDKQLEAKIFSNNRLKTILLELHRSNSEPVTTAATEGRTAMNGTEDLHLNASDDESIFLMLEKANKRMLQGRRNVSSGAGGVGGLLQDVNKAFQGLDLSSSIDFS